MRPTQKFFSVAITLAVFGGGFFVRPASAATFPTSRANEISVGTAATKIQIFGGKFNNGASVASADIDNNGVDEFIVGAGEYGGPRVEVYRQAGNKIAQFNAFDKTVNTGIFVAAGDLLGDGKAEIVVGPQPGYKPEVRVFSVQGKLLWSFNAFETSFTGGVHVAVLPYHDGQAGSIVVGSGVGRVPEVRVFTYDGKHMTSSWFPFGKVFGNGVPVAAMWSVSYGQPVIVAGNGGGYSPKIQIYGISTDTVLTSWYAYDSKLKTGVNVAAYHDVIVTATGPQGGPEVRTFSDDGTMLLSYFAFESNFRGGALVAITADSLTPIAVPTAQPTSAAGTGKRIVVNLKHQTLKQYVFGHLVGEHRVSSGKWSTPTPIGTFAVKNKIPVAYSASFNLYMEWWMAFSPDGKDGLHGLPFWKLKNGGKLYEGAAHIGTPVSHGCVRQTVAEAKALYAWTPIGTPVIIEN